MPDPGASDLPAPPTTGRRFVAHRRVRLADASPAGRLRLDAVARYLQDVSSDDTADAALDDDMAWVVRRLLIRVERSPVFREPLSLETWCSGTGRSWAERRVSVAGDEGGRAEAAVLWVHVDQDSGRPRRLGDQFYECYGAAAADRRVSARLQFDGTPPAAGVVERPWPVRFADVDLLGHVNNAAYLTAVEEELARRRDLRAPFQVEVEYRSPIEPGDDVVSVVRDDDRSLQLWLCPAASGISVDGAGEVRDAYACARVRSD